MTQSRIAIWAITPNGVDHAETMVRAFEHGDVFLSSNPDVSDRTLKKNFVFREFDSLKSYVESEFHKYEGHVFIMSTGIVVRMIAPLIRSKTTDPAVVVMDDRGNHAISLLSGHIGGANALASAVAGATGATPVITTATDVNEQPAIDVLASDQNFAIENPEVIKTVNMALLTGKPVYLYDPYGTMDNKRFDRVNETDKADVVVDDRLVNTKSKTLLIRPGSLVAGIGCNRGTDIQEIRDLLTQTLAGNKLALKSLCCIATIDIKNDETGILDLAEELAVPVAFFTRDELDTVKTITSPSTMVEKHVGVKSVCEAAAILAAKQGKLIVPKQKTPNVTVAVARMSFTS